VFCKIHDKIVDLFEMFRYIEFVLFRARWKSSPVVKAHESALGGLNQFVSGADGNSPDERR
jgi:hypothetical protein